MRSESNVDDPVNQGQTGPSQLAQGIETDLAALGAGARAWQTGIRGAMNIGAGAVEDRVANECPTRVNPVGAGADVQRVELLDIMCIRTAHLLGLNHDVERADTAGGVIINDGSAGNPDLRHDVRGQNFKGGDSRDRVGWVDEDALPEQASGRWIWVVGVEGIDTIVFCGHEDDVVSAPPGN